MDGALRLRSCGEPPPVGVIAGFSCNTRHWPGHAADFLCVRLEFSMFSGNAALDLASFFMTSLRCAACESLAMPVNIAT